MLLFLVEKWDKNEAVWNKHSLFLLAFKKALVRVKEGFWKVKCALEGGKSECSFTTHRSIKFT